MTIREVAPGRWRSCFERFSRIHRAWLATVHRIEPGGPITRVPSVAIDSVALVPGASDAVLRLTFANGISLCAPRLCGVRIQEADDGAEWALEADTVDGTFLRMAFRATALPDELDAIAPGEAPADTSASR